jgi:membrane fusion protein, heavy metal efflux system
VMGKPTVFVHSAPETFIAKTVSVGDTDGKVIEIKAGIEKNERVATGGNYQLKQVMLGL